MKRRPDKRLPSGYVYPITPARLKAAIRAVAGEVELSLVGTNSTPVDPVRQWLHFLRVRHGRTRPPMFTAQMTGFPESTIPPHADRLTGETLAQLTTWLVARLSMKATEPAGENVLLLGWRLDYDQRWIAEESTHSSER